MIRDEAIRTAAASIGVEAAVFAALVDVESSGTGLQDGRAVIRLEVHHLWRNTSGEAREAVNRRFKVNGPKSWEGHVWRPTLPSGPWVDLHRGQANEWRAYDVARSIDAQAAIVSTSWGLGQVLGVHWVRGHASPEAFEAAQATEAGQIQTMADFCAGDQRLVDALRAKDWRAIARIYNGAGKVGDYAPKLERAYRRHA